MSKVPNGLMGSGSEYQREENWFFCENDFLLPT